MPSRWQNIRNISKPSLLFRIISILSRCHYYDVKCSYPALLHPSKNAKTRHYSVNLVYNVYNVLVVIKASPRIVMLD